MIIDHCRDVEEFRKLYESRPMPNQYNFDWLVGNPNLFCFYEEDAQVLDTPSQPSPLGEGASTLRGFITVQREEGLLTLSGTSVRKNMRDNIDAIIMVCNLFKEDMYAFTPLKHARLVLKKAGFEKMDNGVYKRRYMNG